MATEDFDDTEVGSLERFSIVFKARLDVLMNNRRLEGKATANAGSAKAFLMAVINHDRGSELGCCARQETLQRESGLSPDSQSRVATILEDAGVVRVVRRHKQTGARKRFSSNQYFVNLSVLHAMALLEPVQDVHGSDDPKPDDGSSRNLRPEPAANAQSTEATAEKTSRSLRDDRTSRSLRDESGNIPQSAVCSSRSLRDDHPAVCGTKNKQTTGQQSTGQHTAAVSIERENEPVCLSSEAERRRQELTAQATRMRQIARATKALRDAGVWAKVIPNLLAAAARASGGDPLPRVEEVVAAAQVETQRKQRARQEFHAAKWITAAIEQGWQLKSRRTA